MNSQSRRLEQQQWEDELINHDCARRAYHHRGDPTLSSKQRSKFAETESDSSILVTNRIQVDTASQKDGTSMEEWECAATSTRGQEDVRYVRQDPTYKV